MVRSSMNFWGFGPTFLGDILMVQHWTIWGRKTNGNVVKCFTWRGERSAGLQRAYMEAKDWDYGLAYCWAEKAI